MIHLLKTTLVVVLAISVLPAARGSHSKQELAVAFQTATDDSRCNIFRDPARDDDGPGVFIHLVQPGETIASLCKMYRVDLEQLRRVNLLKTDTEVLAPGRKLVIP